MSKLRLSTAVGTMQIIARGGPQMSIQSLGLTPDDYKLLTGVEVWTANVRTVVRRALDSYVYGVLDILGLPRFELPAEYLAAVISVFVHPVNYFPACVWLSGGLSAEDIKSGRLGEVPEGFEKVKPEVLFCLVIELHEHADSTAASYANRTGAAIERLSMKGKK